MDEGQAGLASTHHLSEVERSIRARFMRKKEDEEEGEKMLSCQ